MTLIVVADAVPPTMTPYSTFWTLFSIARTQNSFHKNWLNVAAAPAPTDIQWRNLQIGGKERLLRECFTAFLSLVVILLCIISFLFFCVGSTNFGNEKLNKLSFPGATMIYAAKVYEGNLMADYPDRPCPNYDITPADVCIFAFSNKKSG